MKHYSIKIIFGRIKQIPKKVIFLWLALIAICLYCALQFIPICQSLDDLQECTIDVEKIFLLDSHDPNGSRMKLELISRDTTYYVWYPQTKYIDYAYNIENDLLTGNVTSLEAKITNIQSLRDRILNQKRIVDLRCGNTVYYGLDTEQIDLQQQYASLWGLLIVIVAFWILYSLLIGLIYGVISFKKKLKESTGDGLREP